MTKDEGVTYILKVVSIDPYKLKMSQSQMKSFSYEKTLYFKVG